MLIEDSSLLQNHSVIFAKLSINNCSCMRKHSLFSYLGLFGVSSLKTLARLLSLEGMFYKVQVSWPTHFLYPFPGLRRLLNWTFFGMAVFWCNEDLEGCVTRITRFTCENLKKILKLSLNKYLSLCFAIQVLGIRI